jgi:hypothetical protein
LSTPLLDAANASAGTASSIALDQIGQSMIRKARSGFPKSIAPKLDPEGPCSVENPERDGDRTKSHRALSAETAPV